MLPELNTYNDLLLKLDYDRERLANTNHIYELLDCLLTLNALPEWIANSQTGNSQLMQIVEEKIKVMKGHSFNFDENLIHSDIDQQLRLIRLVCNHAKHKTDSVLIPTIKREYDASFPMVFPIKFGFIIAVGKQKVDAEFVVSQVANFWKKAISDSKQQ